jgi:hypothetical protein
MKTVHIILSQVLSMEKVNVLIDKSEDFERIANSLRFIGAKR